MPRVLFALGVAPEHASSYDDAVEDAIREAVAAKRKHVCAIGSCGLDGNAEQAQRDAFKRQIELARELGLPLIVEAEGAYTEALEELSAQGVPERGVLLRAFSGTDEELSAWILAGAYVSFDVRVTADRASSARQAKLVPAERLLVESGAPALVADVLAGSEPRPDQVVFAADVLIGAAGPGAFAQNYQTLFC